MCDQGTCNEWTYMTNIQVIKTCMTNVQVIKSYVQFIQMTNLASMQVTRQRSTTKLPIKQYKTHNNKNTW